MAQKSNQIKLENLIKASDFTWKVLMINLANNGVSTLKKYLRHAVNISHCINMFFYGAFNSTCLIKRPFDFEKITFGISIMGTVLMLIVKYSCTHWNTPKLYEVIEKLPKIYPDEDV